MGEGSLIGMKVKVYKLYARDGRLRKVLDAEYNGNFLDLIDFIRENIKGRLRGRYFVHIISKRREFLMMFDGEYEIGKAKFCLGDYEVRALRKILCEMERV